MARRTLAWANKLTADIDAGRLPFGDAARDNSDNAEAAEGGYIGWIGKGQVDSGQGGRDLRGALGQGLRSARGRRTKASTCSS